MALDVHSPAAADASKEPTLFCSSRPASSDARPAACAGWSSLDTWGMAKFTIPDFACALQDEVRVYGSLMALRLLARKYEFRDEVGSLHFLRAMQHCGRSGCCPVRLPVRC